MENNKIDFEAPLLSVRRFSDTAGPESVRRPTAGQRASLPYYKPELNSGPVRNPGVVPFVWENKPGEPKNGLVSESSLTGRQAQVAPRLPPGRITKDSEFKGVRSVVKPGSSVRTRKVVTFSVDSCMEKIPERNEDASDEIDELYIRKDRETEDVVEMKDVEVIEKEKEEEEKRIEQDELPILAVCNGSCGVDENLDVAADEEDRFSDALDTLSQNESVFLNCSVSGISGITAMGKGTGSCSTDPHIRDFMMGRFLPAAQAMTSDSPQYTFRKTVKPMEGTMRIADRIANGELRRTVPVPHQHRSNLALQHSKEQEVVDKYDTDEENEDDYDNAGQFLPKGCGFLPSLCLKGNFGRLNPVPGMNFQVRKSTPPKSRSITKIKSSLQAPLGHPEDSHSWEDVYKHKMVQGNKQLFGDESKLKSESNELTFSSESPTAEESSTHRRSAAGGTQPFRKEATDPLFHIGKEYLGILSVPGSKSSNTDGSDLCEKDGENFWESASHHRSHSDSASASPALEKTVYVDSINMPEARISKSSSLSTTTDTKEMINLSEKDFDAGTESQRMENGFVIEVNSSQLKIPQAVVPDLLYGLYRLNHEEMGSANNLKQNNNESNQLINSGKGNPDSLQSLLPPPLPKTPSESWLSRTLPSVTSKNSTPQTLLSIGCHPRKKALQVPVANQKLETNAELPKSQIRRIRFAEVLASPPSPKSEI